jgi:hypothetical protein
MIILGACLGVSLAAVATEVETPEPGPEVVPGQLDVIERTAVALDGRPPEGVQATSYRWRIVEGEGGKLFNDDQEDAVFLAPQVERGVKVFVIELNVTYADQPPSTRTIRIRVLPTDPEAAKEGEGESDTQWLEDYYRRLGESQQNSAPPATGGGGSRPSVSIGVAGGSGGRRGSIGVRVPLSYPVSQPVPIPPPGQSRTPGEGPWGVATPVPRDQLATTLPPEIAKRYE